MIDRLCKECGKVTSEYYFSILVDGDYVSDGGEDICRVHGVKSHGIHSDEQSYIAEYESLTASLADAVKENSTLKVQVHDIGTHLEHVTKERDAWRKRALALEGKPIP